MRPFAEEIESITVGAPAHFGGLTIFPLFRNEPGPGQPGYVLLEEAIVQGTARITELESGGSVPELRFENLGELPVLLLDGEELIGAKQNRALNLTILAPAKQAIVIPVSCVEAGRWHMESGDFRPAQHLMYSRARAARAAQVTAAMASTGARRSDQMAVWDEIAAKSERLGTASPTQAMCAMYDSHSVSIEAYLRAFSWTERQAGILFSIGPETIGMDLLDHPESMRRLYPKMLRSYALDAVEAPGSPAASAAEAAEFLARAGRCLPISRPAAGMGKDVRLTGGVCGAALWAERRYVHVCAFAAAGDPGPAGFRTRMSRPARRRAR